MTSCPEATSWGFWDLKKKKTVSRDLNSEQVSWNSSLEEGSQRDQLGSTKCAAHLLKKLCLSLLMPKNLKLKKVNKSFVTEPIFRVFRIPICVWTWWKFYAYEYLGRIFERGYITFHFVFREELLLTKHFLSF